MLKMALLHNLNEQWYGCPSGPIFFCMHTQSFSFFTQVDCSSSASNDTLVLTIGKDSL